MEDNKKKYRRFWLGVTGLERGKRAESSRVEKRKGKKRKENLVEMGRDLEPSKPTVNEGR